MGKLLKRISVSDVMKQSKEFVGKEMNIVLNTNAVFFGKLKEVGDHVITLIDLRGKKLRFKPDAISVIVYDVER